jgi:hypothetical protein
VPPSIILTNAPPSRCGARIVPIAYYTAKVVSRLLG